MANAPYRGVNPVQDVKEQNLQPEDYLEKQNVGSHLKEAISLMLENRPENPIQFLADHFKNLQSTPSNLGGLGTSVNAANGVVASSANIMRAYRAIQLNKHDMKSFNDNVFQAYTYLEKDHGVSGVKGFDFIKLAKMLCIEQSQEIVKGILSQIAKRDEENVDFDEFLCGVRTILMYDSYFEEMDTIFRHLDFLKRNKIRKDDLVQAVTKLRDESIGPHELRVPPVTDIERGYMMMPVEEDGCLSLEEFRLLMYRATLEDE